MGSDQVSLDLRNPKSKAVFDILNKEVLRDPKYHCKVKDLLSLLATGFTESYQKWQQVIRGSDTPDPAKALSNIASHLGELELPFDPRSFLKNSRLFNSTTEIAQAEETMRQGIQTVCVYLTEELLPQRQVP